MQNAQRLAENLAAVQQRIKAAAERVGRSPDSVRLVAVTKYISPAVARLLVESGCHDLGESRPQQLWEKAEKLNDLPLRWHMIGHLQRNKIARTLPLIAMLHSGDSQRLLSAVDRQALAVQRSAVPVLIEINVSGDASKHGFAPEQAEAAIRQALGLPHVHVGGLMCMAAREGDLARARREFAQLRTLRDQLQVTFGEAVDLRELSMGMSSDFEEAIEEGATIVRVGSALYEGLDA